MTEVPTRSQAGRESWLEAPYLRRRYTYRRGIPDTLLLCWAVWCAAYVSVDPVEPLLGAPQFFELLLNCSVLSAAMVVVWSTVLAAVGSHSYRVIVAGAR